MPHTVKYRPSLIDELISSHRIASYSKVFVTNDDAQLVGAYLWNSHVCAALYPLLAAVEVTLRNSIDAVLTADLGRFWWKKGTLQYRSFTPGAAKLPWPVEYLTHNFLSAYKAAQKDRSMRLGRRFSGVPDHQEIIAKTDFSTWEFLLESEYMGDNLIWPKHLGRVFRGAWPTHQGSDMLTRCRERVSLVRRFRNRIFHHEPAWKRFGVTNEQHAVIHLHDKIDKLMELIVWISPEKADLLTKSGTVKNARRACSVAEITRFKYQLAAHDIDSMDTLVRVAQAVTRNNEVARLSLGGEPEIICTLQSE